MTPDQERRISAAELQILYVGIVLGGLLGMVWGRYSHLPFLAVVGLFVLANVLGFRLTRRFGRWHARRRAARVRPAEG